MQPVAPLSKLGTYARNTSRWGCIRRNKAREGGRTDGEEQHASGHSAPAERRVSKLNNKFSIRPILVRIVCIGIVLFPTKLDVVSF
jgi:hypothetical protein